MIPLQNKDNNNNNNNEKKPMDNLVQKDILTAAVMREIKIGQTYEFPIKNYDRVGTYKNRYGKSLQRKFKTHVDEAKGVIYLTRVS
jgi:hypothetical protein